MGVREPGICNLQGDGGCKRTCVGHGRREEKGQIRLGAADIGRARSTRRVSWAPGKTRLSRVSRLRAPNAPCSIRRGSRAVRLRPPEPSSQTTTNASLLPRLSHSATTPLAMTEHLQSAFQLLYTALADFDDPGDGEGPPPGSPPRSMSARLSLP